MTGDSNRTWIESGSYSLPQQKKRISFLQKIGAILFWPFTFIFLAPFLNMYWNRYFGVAVSLHNVRFAWETLARMVWFRGPIYEGTFWALAPTLIALTLAIWLFRVLLLGASAKSAQTATLYGSSHWATYEEVKKAGLVSNAGAIVGGFIKVPEKWKFWKNSETIYLKDEGPTHIIAIAPTRSGKGISLVVPTLLTWHQSAFVLDIKGENWLLSAGWRSENVGPCLRFEPTDPSGTSARYNPLCEIALGTSNETREVQTIASMLIDPDGKGLEDHWTKAAFTILTGAITHEIYVAKDQQREPSIERVREELASGDCKETLISWETYQHTSSGTHPIVLKVVKEVQQKAEKELSGVFSTANAALGLWTDPTICMNTTNHTFNIHDMVNGISEEDSRPVSMYIVIPPSDLTRLRPILRLFVTQVVFALTQKMETKDGKVTAGHKHRLLLMLDEFPQLKKLDLFEAALAFIGGYGLKAYMICQSFKQLTDIYGKDETVSANCRVQICYAPNDEDTARIVSEKCGKTTVTVGSSSISGKRFAIGIFGKTQESISYQQQGRDLLQPDETRRLGQAVMEGTKVVEGGDMLIFASGTAPIYGKQTPFFLDSVLDKRSKIAPPTTSPTAKRIEKLKESFPGAVDTELQNALTQDTPSYVPDRPMEIEGEFDMSPQDAFGSFTGNASSPPLAEEVVPATVYTGDKPGDFPFLAAGVDSLLLEETEMEEAEVNFVGEPEFEEAKTDDFER